MHDTKSNTLTEFELAQIHGGSSSMDAQGHVHGDTDSITLPDGTVLQLIPLNATPPESAAAAGQAAGNTFKAAASSLFAGGFRG